MTSSWDELFAIACKLIDDVNRPHVLVTDWSFGGGTAMMLQINHRESHDVDIFLTIRSSSRSSIQRPTT